MQYRTLANAYEKLALTSKRLEITDILVELFKNTPTEIIDKVIFLTQGKLHPSWFQLPEIGIAEKSAIKAVWIATDGDINEIEQKVRELGDLGTVFEKGLKKKVKLVNLDSFILKPDSPSKKSTQELRTGIHVKDVYSILDKIAKASGPGSAEDKVQSLADLLKKVDEIEGKWILRTVLGKLRIGVADQTIMDALAITFTGDKTNKQYIEYGYNIHPDLGEIARKLVNEGLNSIKKMKVEYLTPVRMMLTQRLPSLEEILEKLGGKCACEFKYDGERLQIHVSGKEMMLFTRNLENVTSQHPELHTLIRTLKSAEFIIEGEIVAINEESGELLPFQELMHRRRKYSIQEAIEKYPTCLFVFDILKLNEEDLLDKPYTDRRKLLEGIVKELDHLKLATAIVTDNAKDMEKFFNYSIESGCEGIMAKSVQPDSIYQAGARGWIWIKFKQSYQKMRDSIDVVVVGAYMGHGRRAQTYGALLCAVLNRNDGTYETICKLGSGFTDDNLAQFLPKFEEIKRETKPLQIRTLIKPEPDIWFEPKFIAELIGDEITLSGVHPAGFGVIRANSGLAIRFPRFIRWREDKALEDITTTEEIIDMYKRQIKQV
ncbi:MAG: ATP-dependent DNA ligase [Candidatus Helarchaeota archaeon]|nr:ATP-dependent DNA ligase [Candidatus Helarchaeota archaeon]